MPRVIRRTLLSVRDLLASGGPFIVLALLLLWGAFAWLKPAPPRHVVLVTGPEQSAYAEFGVQYAKRLSEHGITVELHTTGGAAENLRILRDPKQQADFGFIQGGASDAILKSDETTDGPRLESLGSLFYEPVWLFYHDAPSPAAAPAGAPGRAAARAPSTPAAAPPPAGSDTLTELMQRPGFRLNAGGRGSGGPNLLRKLLHANHVDIDDLKPSRLDESEAVAAFVDGKLDAISLVTAPESLMVQMLLMTPGVRLFDFTQADAYSRLLPFLSALTLPRGVVDLAKDVPPQDVHLIAPTTSLVARVGTHPALEQLFVEAAHDIHGGSGWFARVGQFPTASNIEWPLAAEAQRYYRNGAPLMQRYLPFWLANLIDRMWVVLVSIVAVLIPLSRVVPPLYQFRVRSRIFRWYGQLRDIEDKVSSGDARPDDLRRHLDALDARVERLPIPLSHADALYALRSHIDLVRERLHHARERTDTGPAP